MKIVAGPIVPKDKRIKNKLLASKEAAYLSIIRSDMYVEHSTLFTTLEVMKRCY
ncbi:MAG: hypothetical protein MRY49_02250 [Candidatus Pacebacteria bacterium]|nr:hypothetical protein [Candidatus Paceibacterota bacterium]